MKKKQNKRKKGVASGVVLLLGILVGGVCGFFLPMYIDRLFPVGTPMAERVFGLALIFLSVYVAFLIQIMAHEAGHLVFGLISGYRFCSYRIGSFMIVKCNGRFKFKRMSLAGTGGQCLMAPPDMKDGNFPVLLYNFGGAIANLILSVIAFLLILLCESFSIPELFFVLVFVFGVLFAGTNGVPMQTGLVDNDGQNALSLSKNESARRAFWLQLRINEQVTNGVRLKDMPAEWFALPSDSEMKNSMTATIAVFACNRLMDEHRFSEAEALMEKIIGEDNAIAGIHRTMLICDLVYCETIGQNREERLQTLLDKQQKKVMKAMQTFISVQRTEYAYAALAEKDKKKASRILAGFERSVRTYPYDGDIASERELIQIVAEKQEGGNLHNQEKGETEQ